MPHLQEALKIIFKLAAEMPEPKGNGHFQIFTAIFAAMQGSPTNEDGEPSELVV